MSKLKNNNIKMYAERAVCANGKGTVVNTVIQALKVLYWVVAAFAIMTCLMMMIGNLIWMGEYKNGANADEIALFNENRMQFITMLAAVFALVASYFLLHFKLCVPFALVGCVDCVIIFTTLYSVSKSNDIVNGGMANFWIMAVPAIVCAALAIALGVMLFITYRLKIPAEYDRIINDLYKSHTASGEKPISPEEFEKICDEYKGEEIFRTDIPLKKSVRRRKEKQQKAD